MLNYSANIRKMIKLVRKVANRHLGYSQYYKLGQRISHLPLKALTQKSIERLIVSGNYKQAVKKLHGYLA